MQGSVLPFLEISRDRLYGKAASHRAALAQRGPSLRERPLIRGPHTSFSSLAATPAFKTPAPSQLWLRTTQPPALVCSLELAVVQSSEQSGDGGTNFDGVVARCQTLDWNHHA
ncbi:hypothetical protein CB1_001250017 [Camelus ferus]|nr:hypothetical protein CB1_001250017 [Camelus ferus]